MFPFFRRMMSLTKNPRLTGNRGFLKVVCCLSLELSSRVAEVRQVAMPNGHAYLITRAAQLLLNRKSIAHIKRPEETLRITVCQKEFRKTCALPCSAAYRSFWTHFNRSSRPKY